MSGITTVVRDDDGSKVATVHVEFDHRRDGTPFVYINCESAQSFCVELDPTVARVLAFVVHEVLP